MKFKPGQSGNPNGRPPGRPDRRSAWRQALADELPAIVETLVKQAKEGDPQAIALILSRVLPPLRAEQAPVALDVPQDATTGDCAAAVLRLLTAGHISAETAKGLLEAIRGASEINSSLRYRDGDMLRGFLSTL